MSTPIIRIAVCQIECHPAIYASHMSYPEEPFLPVRAMRSLSVLGAKGMDVSGLQELCRRQYGDWQKKRILGILRFLERLDPVPGIIVFPEGAVPIEVLPAIRRFCRKTQATVFAGSHSPKSTAKARRVYEGIGIGENALNRILRLDPCGILPVITPNMSRLIPKRLKSPLEQNDVSPIAVPRPTLDPIRIKTSLANTSVLPAVCIDALTNPVIAPHGGYAIVVVVSHTASPADFDSFITSQVRNQHVVAYCNDGKYGGSKIQSVQDMREVSWWQNCRAAGQLPAGDAILVRDIDTASLAVQIGVNNPPKTHMMVFLGSVTYGKDISSGYSVSKELDAVRTIEDSETRCERIDKLRHSANATPLQVIRMDHLHGLIRKGVEVGTWWDRVGGDCGLDTLDSLRQTEAILAASCKETLSKSVDMNDPSTSKLILEYVEDCKKASQRVGTTPPATLVPAMQMPGVKNTKPRRAPYVPSGVFRLEMRFADKRDCNRIAEIAAFYLGAGNAITARTVKAWIARNRRIFRVGEFFPNPRNHRNEPHVAGYYSMVPMSIGIYRLLKEGKIHDYEIPEKSIREFTSSDVKAIYIMDLMCCSCCDVHPEGSDRVKHALLEDAVWNVDRILDGNRCIEEVSSLLASKEGIALVRGLGFKRTSVNELGWEFWVLDKIGIEARHENRKIDSLLRNNMFKDRYEVL